MKLFAPISKVEENDDGTLTVTGIASTEAVDSDGETVKASAIEAALPDFFRYGSGNLREMHQPLAAGTVDSAEVVGGQTFIETKVVDPIAVKKVKTGVYKGFSIGGRVTARDAEDRKVINGLKLVEISLVDRPANPEAVIQMWKGETMDEPTAAPAPTPEQTAAVDRLAAMLDKGEISPQRLVELAEGDTTKAAAATPAAPDPAAADPVAAPEADPAPAANVDEPVRKGLYGVGRFAELLECVADCAMSAQWEAEYEGDGSPLPEQLRAWFEQGAGILQAMAAEEVEEMIARLRPAPAMPGLEVVTMAADAGDFAKAGARFSTSTKAVLADVHKAMLECCAKMDGLGYKDTEVDADGDDVKADTATDVAKAAEPAANLAKVAELESTVADLAAKLEAAHASNAALAKRVEEIAAQPAHGKALLKALAIDKTEDQPGSSRAPAIEPIRKADGSVDETLTAIKSIHLSGPSFRLA